MVDCRFSYLKCACCWPFQCLTWLTWLLSSCKEAFSLSLRKSRHMDSKACITYRRGGILSSPTLSSPKGIKMAFYSCHFLLTHDSLAQVWREVTRVGVKCLSISGTQEMRHCVLLVLKIQLEQKYMPLSQGGKKWIFRTIFRVAKIPKEWQVGGRNEFSILCCCMCRVYLSKVSYTSRGKAKAQMFEWQKLQCVDIVLFHVLLKLESQTCRPDDHNCFQP